MLSSTRGALGLLLALGVLTVGWGKTFWRVGLAPHQNDHNLEKKSHKIDSLHLVTKFRPHIPYSHNTSFAKLIQNVMMGFFAQFVALLHKLSAHELQPDHSPICHVCIQMKANLLQYLVCHTCIWPVQRKYFFSHLGKPG